MEKTEHKRMGTFSRRRFIRAVSTGAVALAAGIPRGSAAPSGLGTGRTETETLPGKMKYAVLGRSGIRASVFLGDQMTDVRMYELALASGVNYWHKIGLWAEPAPYELFRKLDRDSFYCDTIVDSLEKDKAIELFERALKKTGLPYIDGFKIHSEYRSAEDVRTKMGAVRAFETLKKQGKTRHLMMSQHSNTAEVFAAAVESELFDVIQIPVNPTVPMDYFTKEKFIQKASHDEYLGLIQKAAEKNIGITAMKVFLGSPKTWDQVPDLKQRVVRYLPDNRSIATALIHWTLSVPGVKAFGNLLYSFNELRENIEAIGGELTANEDRGLREFAAAIGKHVCRGCMACQKANPGGVAVAEILRYSMYHTGYGLPEMARSLYAELPSAARADAVMDLRNYESACPYGLPVGRLLRQAHSRLA